MRKINSYDEFVKNKDLLISYTNELKSMIEWMDTQISNNHILDSALKDYIDSKDKYLDVLVEAEIFINSSEERFKESEEEINLIPVYRKIL